VNGFLELVKSPYWWVTVVLVGIAINLASSYLEKLFAKFSRSWAERSEEAKRKREETIENLLQNPQAKIDAKLNVIHYEISTIAYLLMAVLCFLLSGLLTSIALFASIVLSFC